MDAITDLDPKRHRAYCQIHAMTRAEERGLDLDSVDVATIEEAIEALRPAWLVRGQDRYWINVRHRDVRCRVLYDARLVCIVTVVRDRRRG